MSEYPKIRGPFKRAPERPHPVIPGEWSCEEFEILQDIEWMWTEKIDGTNIRVIWDGHKPEFRGRTDRAQIPSHLLAKLEELFPEEILEQQFGSNEVVLYGEGFGPKIQAGGGRYSDEPDFALFDVRIGRWWLRQGDVTDIANQLDIHRAPVLMSAPLNTVIYYMSRAPFQSRYGEFPAEGAIGRPVGEMLNRAGDRIIVKLKPENVG